MPGSSSPRRLHRSILAVVILYTFVFAVSAFLHHDFDCHQNSRTHCTACQSSQQAQQVEVGAAGVEAVLQLAGHLEASTAHPIETLASPRLAGRSPPAA
jgi:hypothetical protein